MSKLDAVTGRLSLRNIRSHAGAPLYRTAYALILSDGASAALGILYWALAARFHTTRQVGIDSAAISTMMFLAGLAFINLRGTMLRYIPCAGANTQGLVGRAYLVSLGMALAFSAAFLAGGSWLGLRVSFLEGQPVFMTWFVVATMAWSIFSLQDSVLTAMRQAVWVPVENALFGLAKIVFLVAFAALAVSHGIFLSWSLTAVLALAPVSYLIFRRLVPRHASATAGQAAPFRMREIVRFAAGDYFGALFGLMTTTLMPIIVISVAGATANAYYYLAWTIALPLLFISANMAVSLTVEGARDQASLASFTRRALVQITRLLIPAVLVVTIGAPLILRLFGPNYAAESTILLRLLALAAIPYGVNALFLALARVRRQLGRVIGIQGAQCILILGISYALLPAVGIAGVGVAWLVGQSAVAAVLVLARLGAVSRVLAMLSSR